MNRRDTFRLGSAALAYLLFACLDVGCAPCHAETPGDIEPATDAASTGIKTVALAGAAMKIQFLEIVTPDVDAVCNTYELLHGVKFAEPDANLGHARTAKLPGGSVLSVRAPLRSTEEPIIRPYLLVEDIGAEVLKAASAGAKIALPPMKLPGHGWCAIFIQGGVEHGLWQPEVAPE